METIEGNKFYKFDLGITPLLSQTGIIDKYYEDQKRLDVAWDKHLDGEDLDSEDLEHLYEINGPILSVEGKDSRIDEILEGRDIKSDLSEITGFSEEEISISKQEVFLKGKKFHYGDLNFRDVEYASLGMVFPEIVVGNINLANLKSSKGIVGPRSIHGDWYLNNVPYLEDGVLPKKMKGALGLHSLVNLDGFSLPEVFTGPVILGVEHIDGYEFKEDCLAGFLEFPNLKKVRGFSPPRILTGGLYMPKLEDAEDLKAPEFVGSVIDLGFLKTMNGVIFSPLLECNMRVKKFSFLTKKKLISEYPNIVFL